MSSFKSVHKCSIRVVSSQGCVKIILEDVENRIYHHQRRTLKPSPSTEDNPPCQVKAHCVGGAGGSVAVKGTVTEGRRALAICLVLLAHCLCCSFCLLSGDSYSSSPDSTPMGSIESLSSHSSEQNSTTKSTSCQLREKSGGIPWIASPSSSNGQKSLGLWTTSPESSSREDATKTDVESDCQSVASVTSPGDVSPPIDLVKKGPYGLSGLKRASASSLRSISAAEGEQAWSPGDSIAPVFLAGHSG